MKINASKVSNERKSKAWSQQHLADVSALSLRTIQRVENEGTGSLETVKALAACFELDVNALFVLEVKRQNRYDIKAKIVALCSVVVAIVTGSLLFFVQPTIASNIEISAEQIESSADNHYQIYRGNVEIFVPEGMAVEVLANELWGTDAASVVTGSVKVESENATLVIGDGVVIKEDQGIRITTDYAEIHSPIPS